MDDLIYPLVPTYFIAWEGDAVSFGVNNPDQCTTSGLANFETFTDKTAYLARLVELGVDTEVNNG